MLKSPITLSFHEKAALLPGGFFYIKVFSPLGAEGYLHPSNSHNRASRSAPRRFLPTIFPLGSMRKFCGMLSILYFRAASFCQYLRSLTWVQARPSSLIACIHDSRALSSDTPKTVKF